jgi:hypothetical protein
MSTLGAIAFQARPNAWLTPAQFAGFADAKVRALQKREVTAG